MYQDDIRTNVANSDGWASTNLSAHRSGSGTAARSGRRCYEDLQLVTLFATSPDGDVTQTRASSRAARTSRDDATRRLGRLAAARSRDHDGVGQGGVVTNGTPITISLKSRRSQGLRG